MHLKMTLKEHTKIGPNNTSDSNGGNDTEFKKVNEANNILSDDKNAQQYDMERRFGVPCGKVLFGFAGGFDDIIET